MTITDEQLTKILRSAMLLALYQATKMEGRAQRSADELAASLREAGFADPKAIVHKAADLALAEI